MEHIRAHYEPHYTLQTPQDIFALPATEKRALSDQCADLLTDTYKGKYPLSTQDKDAMYQQLDSQTSHLFTLKSEEGDVVAMTALVEKPNPLNGEVSMLELGRTCKNSELMRGMSLRALMLCRIPYAQQYLPNHDVLYSHSRSGDQHDGIRSCSGVQGVWWGGHADIEPPLQTTFSAYSYSLGRPEPFTGFMIATDTPAWSAASQQQHMHVLEHHQPQLQSLLHETSPRMHAHTAPRAASPKTVLRATGPSKTESAWYYYTEQQKHDTNYDAVQSEYHDDRQFSQTLVVEQDILANENAIGTLSGLENDGWQLGGWTPSQLKLGHAALLFSRLHPDYATTAVPALYDQKNFTSEHLQSVRATLQTISQRYTTKNKPSTI